MPKSLPMLALALVTTGCTVGPDYERPEVEAPAAFRFATADAVAPTDIAWWEAFGDPVLTELIDEALRTNFDVRIAAARVEEFAARLGVTRAGAFPQLGYDAGASRSRSSEETSPGNIPGTDRTSDLFSARLNASWELDLWGRVRRLEESARADLLAVEENRRGVIITLVTSVATSYITLRQIDQQLLIARDSLAARAESLRLFELQFSKGVISRLEVAQIRSEFERTAATIPALEREIALIENALSVLLGRAPGPVTRGRTLADLTPPPIPAGLPSDLLRQRPDLRGAEQRLVSANARVGAAMAEFYPRLSLTGLLGVASDELSNLSSSSATLTQLAASVTGPIFTAGRLEGQVRAAEAVERQALDEFLQSTLTALREAEDALVSHDTARREILAQARQVEALAVYATLAERRYDNGYVGYLEVLDAKRSRFDAEIEQARLQASLSVSAINVYKAFGGGWVTIAEDAADPPTE